MHISVQERLTELTREQSEVNRRLSALEAASSGVISTSSSAVIQEQLQSQLRQDVGALEMRLREEVHASQHTAETEARADAEVLQHLVAISEHANEELLSLRPSMRASGPLCKKTRRQMCTPLTYDIIDDIVIALCAT
jgi:predicted house-cleaning noncanonical NTP pyrophosphatase (MazG superfamily)